MYVSRRSHLCRLWTFGHKPDMTTCCEFYASVAALDNSHHGRFASNGVVMRYLGPARGHGGCLLQTLPPSRPFGASHPHPRALPRELALLMSSDSDGSDDSAA